MSRNSKETNYTNFCGVGLYNTLNGFNIGSAIRAAGAFNASFVAVSGQRYKSRSSDFRCMDTELARKRIPIFMGVDSLIPFVPYETEIVLLERDDTAVSLPDFVHPRRALYVFGPEDGAIDATVFKDMPTKKVYIPSEYSMNLAACVYMTLYDRIAKKKSFNVDVIKCPSCGSDHTKSLSELTEDGKIGMHCNACSHDWQLEGV